MNQLSNISQLRNLWLRSPDERLAVWRDFRLELQANYSCDHDIKSMLNAIVTWWEFVPTVNVAIDPFSLETWPTIWEIIDQGECCKYSKGLAVALNAHYIDKDANISLARVRDTENHDEYFIAIINDCYVLNSPYGAVIELSQVDNNLCFEESWSLAAILSEKEH